MKNPNWTDAEIQFIQENYETMESKEIANVLGRTKSAVTNKVKKLGLTKDTKCYGDKEISFVKEHFQEPNAVLASQLGVSIKTIQRIRKDNGISRPTKRVTYTLPHLRKWNDETVKFIQANYLQSNQFLSKELGLDPATIRRIREKFGIDNPNKEVFHIPMSTAELDVKTMLDFLGVNYSPQYPLGKYNVDFVVGNRAIEVQGDYWHGNPEQFESLTERQERAVKTDWEKKKFLEWMGFEVLWVWESEIQDGRAIQKIKTFLSPFAAVKPCELRESP